MKLKRNNIIILIAKLNYEITKIDFHALVKIIKLDSEKIL